VETTDASTSERNNVVNFKFNSQHFSPQPGKFICLFKHPMVISGKPCGSGLRFARVPTGSSGVYLGGISANPFGAFGVVAISVVGHPCGYPRFHLFRIVLVVLRHVCANALFAAVSQAVHT
jgi:hypothetical protein